MIFTFCDRVNIILYDVKGVWHIAGSKIEKDLNQLISLFLSSAFHGVRKL